MAKQNPSVTVNVNANENEEEDQHQQQLEPANGAAIDELSKAPRLPRWTRQEILVLIQGKRVAENRVRRGRVAGMGIGSGQALEPKWASVSAYCKRHGVNRGPVQCRKRWSNLSGDYKKIKEWESQVREETDSFWVMRNDLRRERRLPGFFDREVYDILDGASGVSTAPGLALALAAPSAPEEEAEADVVFDSGRSAADDGLFSDFEVEEGGGGASPVAGSGTVVREVQPIKAASPGVVPILEKQYHQPTTPPSQAQGTASEKQPAVNPEIGPASNERRKRQRVTSDADEDTINLQEQLVDALEKNGKMLAAQLEAQNTNYQLDREQRKDLAVSLVAVLNKLADAIVKVADKL